MAGVFGREATVQSGWSPLSPSAKLRLSASSFLLCFLCLGLGLHSKRFRFSESRPTGRTFSDMAERQGDPQGPSATGVGMDAGGSAAAAASNGGEHLWDEQRIEESLKVLKEMHIQVWHYPGTSVIQKLIAW